MSKAVPSNLSKYHKPYNWNKIKSPNAEIEDQDSVEPLKDCDEIFYAIFYSLSTDECFRLMGFEQTIRDKKLLSRDHLYGQAGNSMAVDVLKAIYKHIDLPQYANS